jgi:hypothetical protein
MDTEIRYRESSARPFESTGAFLTADDVNELCQRRIEAERERTHALLTELLIQICDNRASFASPVRGDRPPYD